MCDLYSMVGFENLQEVEGMNETEIPMRNYNVDDVDDCPFRRTYICDCEPSCDYEKFNNCVLDDSITKCDDEFPFNCPLKNTSVNIKIT